MCPQGSQPWTYYEWLFTMRPGIFGLIGGIANPSGLALMLILTTMVVCSLPFVRRGGYFEVCDYCDNSYFFHDIHRTLKIFSGFLLHPSSVRCFLDAARVSCARVLEVDFGPRHHLHAGAHLPDTLVSHGQGENQHFRRGSSALKGRYTCFW